VQALQVFGQLISALVAALGATGYVLVLGAIVLWIRLREGEFPKEVPLSFASREELLVLGAQALAVWLVLAVALVALAARLMTAQGLSRRDMVADVVLGVSVTAATQATIDGAELWITVPIVILLGLSIVMVGEGALVIRPPLATWIAPLLAAAIGVLLPLAVDRLGDEQGPGTRLAAWAAFLAVILCLPSLRAQRLRIAANAAAVNRLEMERADLVPTGNTPPVPGAAPAPPRLQEVNRLLATLREHLAAARRRFWLRGTGVGIAALFLLGGIAIASQFEKQHLFRAAVVSLNTGRCVSATYLSRNNDNIVLGDQRRYKPDKQGKLLIKRDKKDRPPENKVVVVPTSEVLEVQVKDPTAAGVPMTTAVCSNEALIAPDGSNVEPFRGPKGEKGDNGATGKTGKGDRGDRGPTGKTGATGDTGPKGDRGPTGKTGATGDTGPKGDRGPTGKTGATGDAGPKGDRGPKGDKGEKGDPGVAGSR